MLRVVRVVVARNKFNRFAFTHHKSLEQYSWRNQQTICSRGQQSSDVYTGIECVYTKAITWISREILTASKRNRMYTYCCRQWLSNRERVFFWIWVNFFLKSFRKVSLGWQREHGKAMSWWRTTQEYTTFTGPWGIKRNSNTNNQVLIHTRQRVTRIFFCDSLDAWNLIVLRQSKRLTVYSGGVLRLQIASIHIIQTVDVSS